MLLKAQIKDELRFYLVREKQDILLFESKRAIKCGNYEEEYYTAQYNEKKNILLDHFSSESCDNGVCVFNWVNGETSYIPDPRMYFDNNLDEYMYEQYKADLRDAIYYLKPQLLDGDNENTALLEYHQEQWFSRIAEFMHVQGANQIPNLSNQSKINEIKSLFYEHWKKSDPWGFYWEWNTIKEQRIEEEKQALIERLQAEEAVRQYLEDQENSAIFAMITGAVGAVGGVVVMVVFPPSTLVGTIAGVADVGFSAASFAEGYSKYSDIQNGLFDSQKTYNVIEGVLCKIDPENGHYFFDLANVLLGVSSASGVYTNVMDIGTVTGSELKAIISAFGVGTSVINVSGKEFEIKQP
ncbi:hypothetical protein L21SP5_00087 [Salinivirga cyanobacteriivorans]|uniref:Uncharacterized protein n=1 Tax=Salinivirga cyanobacteriivorans TaxID=1307839 RepID=A0A0S2HUM6_9BACT|nr:hypothetical protein [Salinivirga cyanobacteriivorans]ALO13769.1 hypothetical protein L21SP5_00087 [Salinivirga cyanobacteriivorans]